MILEWGAIRPIAALVMTDPKKIPANINLNIVVLPGREKH